MLVFGASIVFVFFVLAPQYESWSLPLAVILIVPMCLLAAVSSLLLRGMDVNILAQVGFVVLVGLAAKNAILIVEFARQAEDEGKNRFDAAAQAARTRLRPILMTSFAFIFGVVPLAIATGAGAECASRSAPPSFSACSALPDSVLSLRRCSMSSCAGCLAGEESYQPSVLRCPPSLPSSFSL